VRLGFNSAGVKSFLLGSRSWIRPFSQATSTSNFLMCWPYFYKTECCLIFTQKPWWYCRYVSFHCTQAGTNQGVRISFDGLFRANAQGTWFFRNCDDRVRTLFLACLSVPTHRENWERACGVCWWMISSVWQDRASIGNRDSCMTSWRSHQEVSSVMLLSGLCVGLCLECASMICCYDHTSTFLKQL